MDEGLKIKISAEANGVQETFVKVSTAAKKSADAIGELDTKAKKTGQALVDVSRIISDAPYAILSRNISAVQNNIDPLIQSFGRLKAETGSTTGALKSMISGLAGSGGLGIGVSVVSSLLVLFGSKLFAAGKAATEAKENLFDYRQELQSTARSLGDAEAKATRLVAALNSGQLDNSQRKAALKELKGINEEYFGSLKDEKGIIEGLSGAYANYIKSIANIGRTKAIEGQLSKLFAKKLELELKIDPTFNAATDAGTLQRIAKLQKELAGLGGPVTNEKELNPIAVANNEVLKRRIQLQQQILSLQAGKFILIDAPGTRKEISDIELQINGLSKLLQDVGKFEIKTPDIKGDPPRLKAEKAILDVERIDVNFDKARIETVGEAKNFQDIISDMVLRRQPLKLPKMDNAVLDEYRDASKLMTSFRKQFNELGLDLPNIRVGDVGGVDGLNKQFEKLLENAQTINSLIGSSLTPAFEDMFSTIFAGGDGLQSFFQTLGQSVQQLIAKLIAAQIQALLLSVLTGLALPKTGGGIPMRGRITGIGGAAGFGGMSSLGALGGVAGLSAQGGGRMGSTPGGISVNVGVTGSLRGNGRDLVAVISNTTQRQGRNF